ncbi:hypothetical protein SLA2020_374240 [Shorea laevis]
MAENLKDKEDTRTLGEETEEEDESEDWEDWAEEEGDDEDEETEFLCLFCDSKYGTCDAHFEHCRSSHQFDFQAIRKEFGLDFYGSFKLINYVRSQVAENRCWSCGVTCLSNQELLNHLHHAVDIKDVKLPWDDDKYLTPFMQEDSLLYSFGEDEEGEDDYKTSFDKEEVLRDLKDFGYFSLNEENIGEEIAVSTDISDENRMEEAVLLSNGHLNEANSSEKALTNGTDCDGNLKDKHSRIDLVNLVGKQIKKVNEDYFGSYSSFGIHREMIGDKVRTDAYRQALLKNPSLLNGAVVMDVGCGTGILSLFAVQAGASRVIAVEASEKMAAVATQIAKDNGLWCGKIDTESNKNYTGGVEVVQSMVEELDKFIQMQPHSVDIIVSEWMGYCLLYESMLSSVLFARDQWLKPGGAILPDTATIFAAGFGKGSTSLPFWENVYGLNMSCIGREVVEDASKIPIVDVVDECNLVTNAATVQTFDLATMKPDEVDFTARVELEPKFDSLSSISNEKENKTTLCYGIVLWFETGFTSRFCKEMPVVLSTSPYTPRTHWSQTILTFREPIAIALGNFSAEKSSAIGTVSCPASKIQLRISIARATQHRSIDISLEAAGVLPDGRKHSWPVQIFNLY